MKRLMIPVGAGALALAGTVALALGPNSSGEWGVDGTAGGVLSVQRPPAVAGEPAPGGDPNAAKESEPPAPAAGTEPTPGAEPTSGPGRTNTPLPTKDATSTPTAVAVEPKHTPTLLATPTPASAPVLAERVKEVPAPTKPVDSRAAKDEPAKVDQLPAPAVPKQVAEPAKNGLPTATNAMTADRAP